MENLKLNRKVAMEQFIGVEEARGSLGKLVDEVAQGAEPIVLAKRGRAKAVLLSFDDYGRLKSQASRWAREELRDWLREVRKQVEEADLDPSVVDEAIAAAREMR